MLFRSDGDGCSLCIMDVVYFEDDMVEKLSRAELRKKLGSLMDENLDAREKKILLLRYGMDGSLPRTQREVAEICNISRSYVSRIEKKALEKLRTAYGEKQFIARIRYSQGYYGRGEGCGEIGETGGIAEKQHITGIMYEPWHFRYVGTEPALYITKKDFALKNLQSFTAKKDSVSNRIFFRL